MRSKEVYGISGVIVSVLTYFALVLWWMVRFTLYLYLTFVDGLGSNSSWSIKRQPRLLIVLTQNSLWKYVLNTNIIQHVSLLLVSSRWYIHRLLSRVPHSFELLYSDR